MDFVVIAFKSSLTAWNKFELGEKFVTLIKKGTLMKNILIKNSEGTKNIFHNYK